MTLTIREGYTYRARNGKVFSNPVLQPTTHQFPWVLEDLATGRTYSFLPHGSYFKSGNTSEYDLIEEIPPLGSIKVVERVTHDLVVTPGPLWEGAPVKLACIGSDKKASLIASNDFGRSWLRLDADELRKFAAALTTLADGLEAGR